MIYVCHHTFCDIFAYIKRGYYTALHYKARLRLVFIRNSYLQILFLKGNSASAAVFCRLKRYELGKFAFALIKSRHSLGMLLCLHLCKIKHAAGRRCIYYCFFACNLSVVFCNIYIIFKYFFRNNSCFFQRHFLIYIYNIPFACGYVRDCYILF